MTESPMAFLEGKSADYRERVHQYWANEGIGWAERLRTEAPGWDEFLGYRCRFWKMADEIERAANKFRAEPFTEESNARYLKVVTRARNTWLGGGRPGARAPKQD